MMKKWGIAIIAAGLLFTACNKDDGNDELVQEEQNKVDDDAIVEYLQDHYFSPDRGVIKKFDSEDEADDDYAPLSENATKLPSGVWVVKRPGVTAEGPVATNNENDSILVSYQSTYFKATYEDLAENEKPYAAISGPFLSTISTSGTPAWDPVFYYRKLTDAQIDNGIKLSGYVIEGFTEGLKEFKSTDNDGTELYNFQGAIIVPSRMAYSRDFDYLSGTPSYSYRDCSFVFNFELHRVVPRNN